MYLVFVLPAVLYFRHTGRRDAVLWTLVAWGVVFFPMSLLAMVMQDGLHVLNPLFLLGAIRRTLAPYVGLLLVMAVLGVLFWLVLDLLARSAWLAGPVLLASGYLCLIAAHILGRFYWRYREHLHWDL